MTSQNTRINVHTQAPCYIHTVNVESVLAGVQIYEPYISFIGSSQIGVRRSIPAPAALSTEASAYRAGHAALSADRDLGQPNFGAVAFPYWSPRTDTAFVRATWLSAPISGCNVGISINYAENQWMGALTAGFRTTLAGAQDGRNIAMSAWGKAYAYGDDDNAYLVSPAIYANAIPPIYQVCQVTHYSVPTTSPLAP
ncbi:hypothetical protein [Acidocella sp.]|uniref:hypothetical protein n=1 Tax=Acidocella sp. TaxID=50710 RepID=UPI00262703C6|nr:hypothetical protein [Acidocella sp.]